MQPNIQGSPSQLQADPTYEISQKSLFISCLSVVVLAEDRDLLSSYINKLASNDKFMNCYRTYQRILQNFTDETSDSVRESPQDLLRSVNQAFAQYLQVWLNYLARRTNQKDHSLRENKSWIYEGKIPLVIYRADPDRPKRSCKSVTIPTTKSESFASILGAYAASVSNKTASTDKFSIHQRAKDNLERLVAKIAESTGLKPNICSYHKEKNEYFYITISSSQLTTYLYSITDGNTRLPWIHLLSSAEQSAFLSSFLEFAGGSISEHKACFRLVRQGNLELIKQLSLLFGRFNIYPAIREQNQHGLYFEDPLEIEKLITSVVIPDPTLLSKLTKSAQFKVRRRSYSVSDFEKVEGIISDLLSKVAPAKLTIHHLQEALREDPLPLVLDPKVLSKWLDDEVPLAVKRKRKIDQLELTSFSKQQLEAIGKAILGRVCHTKINFKSVARNISDFFGGEEKLAKRLGIDPLDLNEALKGNPFLDPEVYSKILNCVGLKAEGRLAQQRSTQNIDIAMIWSWLSSADRTVAYSYQAALLLACKEAQANSGNPWRVANQKVAEFRRKSSLS